MIDRMITMLYNVSCLERKTDSEHLAVFHPCVLSRHYLDDERLDASEGDMKEIQLTRGKVTQVSDEDFERLNQWKWYCDTKGYATRCIRHKGNTYSRIFMAREIMNAPKGIFVDHIDHNPLNNQRNNLRFCTNSQNQANRPKAKYNTSGYKGVHLKHSKYWEASLTFQGKYVYIGSFKTAEEAKQAHDKKSIELFGEFAYASFPRED